MYANRNCIRLSFALLLFMSLHSVPAASAQEMPEQIWGCTSLMAINFNPLANADDGSCVYPGVDGGDYPGCTDPTSQNYDPSATVDDGTCWYDDSKDCEDSLFRVSGGHGNFGKLTHFAFPGDPYADSYTEERIARFSVKDTSIRLRHKGEIERLRKGEQDLTTRIKNLEKQMANATRPEQKQHISSVIGLHKRTIGSLKRKIAYHNSEIQAFDLGKEGRFYIPDTLLRPGDIALSPANARKMAGRERQLIKFLVIYEDSEGNQVKHCAQGRFMDTTASNLNPERVDVYDPGGTLSNDILWKDVKRLEN
jgi:hypothetical protein